MCLSISYRNFKCIITVRHIRVYRKNKVGITVMDMCLTSNKVYRFKPTITVPLEWKEAIDRIVRREGYGTVASYIKDLIRRDLKERGEIIGAGD